MFTVLFIANNLFLLHSRFLSTSSDIVSSRQLHTPHLVLTGTRNCVKRYEFTLTLLSNTQQSESENEIESKIIISFYASLILNSSRWQHCTSRKGKLIGSKLRGMSKKVFLKYRWATTTSARSYTRTRHALCRAWNTKKKSSAKTQPWSQLHNIIIM